MNAVANLSLDLGERPMWSRVDIEDPRARAVADRHYSRQTIGADGFVPPGLRFALWYDDGHGPALWTACYNLDPTGTPRWRNTIFRNESAWLTSWLAMRATEVTFAVWLRRYRVLPSVPFTTEIDIAATADRRSKRNPPGHCYFEAGWEFLRHVAASHGRPARDVLFARPERFGVA